MFRINIKSSDFLYLFTVCFVFLCLIPSFPSDYWSIDDAALAEWIAPKLGQGFKGLISYFKLVGFHYDYYPLRDLSMHSDFWLAGKIGWAAPIVLRAHQFVIFLEVFLGLFFLQMVILKKVKKKINPLLMSFGLCLWAVLPVHLEGLTWIAARKDFLAMAMSVWACVFFFSNQVIIFLVFFGLSLLGKASFSLLPLSLLFFSLSLNLELSLRQKQGLGGGFVLGLFSSFLQSLQYSQVNDMRFLIPWSERLQLTITAFGKSFSALFYWGANVLEVENWGGWLDLNQIYFVVGVLVLTAGIGFILYSILKKNLRPAFVSMGLLMLYLPSMSLFFPSRNFFSVRFCEPLFLKIPLLTYFLADRFLGFRKVLFTLISISFLNFYVQSSSFSEGLEISRKSYLHSSQNMSLAQSFYINLINEERWGRSSFEEIQMRKRIHELLVQNCPVRSPGVDSLCYSFWRASYQDDKNENRPDFLKLILQFRSKHSFKSKDELSLENDVLFGLSTSSNQLLSSDLNICNNYIFLCSDPFTRKALIQTLCRYSRPDLAALFGLEWREKLIMVSQKKPVICQTSVSN